SRRFIEIHEFRRETRRRPESAAFDHRRCEIARFFFQFAYCALAWILAVVKSACRNLDQFSPACVAVLPDQNDFVRRGSRYDAHGAWVYDDFPRTFMARGLDHSILANLDMPTLVSDS